jgi:hypothetical protein
MGEWEVVEAVEKELQMKRKEKKEAVARARKERKEELQQQQQQQQQQQIGNALQRAQGLPSDWLYKSRLGLLQKNTSKN